MAPILIINSEGELLEFGEFLKAEIEKHVDDSFLSNLAHLHGSEQPFKFLARLDSPFPKQNDRLRFRDRCGSIGGLRSISVGIMIVVKVSFCTESFIFLLLIYYFVEIHF